MVVLVVVLVGVAMAVLVVFVMVVMFVVVVFVVMHGGVGIRVIYGRSHIYLNLGICLGSEIQVSDLASFVDVIDFHVFRYSLVLIFYTSRKFGFALNRNFFHFGYITHETLGIQSNDTCSPVVPIHPPLRAHPHAPPKLRRVFIS